MNWNNEEILKEDMAKAIGKFLFNNHSHVEMHEYNPDKIIYTEESVIQLLKNLGLEVDWDWYKTESNEIQNKS